MDGATSGTQKWRKKDTEVYTSRPLDYLLGSYPSLPAHRDRGGRVALAIYHCRKITIAAVNGHAVRINATYHLLLTLS